MFSGVRTFFQTVAQDLGYRKHYDGFNIENIPGTKFDKAYHVEAFNFSSIPQNQSTLDLEGSVTVRLFFKAFRDVDDGIQKATNAADSYIAEVLGSERRLTNSSFKNIILNQIVIEPYAISNDNFVVCRMEFTAILFKAIC